MGQEFLDQNHFLRYVGDKYIVKGEYYKTALQIYLTLKHRKEVG